MFLSLKWFSEQNKIEHLLHALEQFCNICCTLGWFLPKTTIGQSSWKQSCYGPNPHFKSFEYLTTCLPSIKLLRSFLSRNWVWQQTMTNISLCTKLQCWFVIRNVCISPAQLNFSFLYKMMNWIKKIKMQKDLECRCWVWMNAKRRLKAIEVFRN